MKEQNLEALTANMDILITGLGVCQFLNEKASLILQKYWNTGETGGIYSLG